MKFLILILLIICSPLFAATTFIPVEGFPFPTELTLSDGHLESKVGGVAYLWIRTPDLEYRIGSGGGASASMRAPLGTGITMVATLPPTKDGNTRFLLKSGKSSKLLLTIEDLGFIENLPGDPGDTVRFTIRRIVFDAEAYVLGESVPNDCGPLLTPAI